MGRSEKKETTLEKREFKVHFIKNGGKQGVDFGMNVKIQYDLYLVDKNRPDLKGKLIESRKGTQEQKGPVFAKGAYLPGIEKAILQMTKNSEVWVFIPWEEGFGDKAVGDGLVPARHDLVAIIKVY